jgi:hypothetical protein
MMVHYSPAFKGRCFYLTAFQDKVRRFCPTTPTLKMLFKADKEIDE